MNKSYCVVFVCNKAYFSRFVDTCNQLVTKGNYHGTICLVIGDDLSNDTCLNCDTIKNNNIIIKYFPNIQFSNEFINIQKNLNRSSFWFDKIFQYHKLHVFNTFFKQWDYIFYLDCGITIYSDITPLLNEATENMLVAHSDAYPIYEWKLDIQFCKDTEQYTKLKNIYNLNVDYFQTTIMLYDTKIIEDNTYDTLLNLLLEYPISVTNDQGIIALYFTSINPHFKQIKTHDDTTNYYDFSRRSNNKYIMLKR